ncbi:MAG: hypothetical protein ACK5RT_17070 [Dolichospermum sp.]
MNQHQKIQNFNDGEGLVKNYNFQIGEIVAGSGVLEGIMPIVSLGVLAPSEDNTPFNFTGSVNKVNSSGAVVSFILKEINPPTSPTAARLGMTFSLCQFESYSISLVE